MAKRFQAAFVGRIDEGGPIDIEKRIDQGFFSKSARGSPNHPQGRQE